MKIEKALIFDLDGTIIDSAPSILMSLKIAIKNILNLDLDLKQEIIGPNLKIIINSILPEGISEKYKIEIEKEFKYIYDEHYCINTNVYADMFEIMDELLIKDYKLFIATNKRHKPTLKILDYLNLRKYFLDIYCCDSNIKFNFNKTQMLIEINKKHKIQNCTYIGDRSEDYQSAEEAKIDFLLANWGYCNDVKFIHEKYFVRKPEEILLKIIYT
jgi:phosphoglycolate phosphatase